MHTHFLDTYSHLNSPIHRIGATLKTGFAIGVILVLVILPPSWIAYSPVAIGLVTIASMTRIPWLFLTKRLIMLEPFVLGAASLALFQPNGAIRFAEIATRSTLCLFTLVILANTTPFSELLIVLRKTRMPTVMLTILALMYRYLFVLKEESARMRSARASRTFTSDKKHAWHTMTTVIAQLFIRASGRGERVYAAMCAGVEMTPAVEVQDLHYHYPNGPAALRLVNFAVLTGECVGLIGPNGAGKSTVLAHLNGLLPDNPSAKGHVLIDGEIVCKRNLGRIRKTVGLVFQEPDDQIFCPTVFEDVAFGPRQFGLNADRLAEVVRESLARVGLEGFDSRAPHRLSGGEKRRVCLAGVLACEPSILLLDEPTSNLDPRGRRQLIELLAGLTVTRIIASHDLEMILQLCSRVIVFDGGRVIADGSARDLLADEELMLAHGLECPASLQRLPLDPLDAPVEREALL